MGCSSWTPEWVFRNSTKPLHRTGEVSRKVIERKLSKPELQDLECVCRILSDEANALSSALTKMVVGSVADFSVMEHSDIDILADLEVRGKRVDFANNVGSELKKLKGVGLEMRESTGYGDGPFAHVKYMIYQSNSIIDLSFVGISSWNYGGAADFHRLHNLSFSVL